jgi:hypothetical protein
MYKKGSIALVILGLVAVIALVGLVLMFTGSATGNVHATSCIDSDNGKNYNSRGLVGVGLYAAEDTCLRFPTLSHPGPGNLVEKGVYLAEGYCENGNKMVFEIFVCPDGCRNGVCV